MSLLLQYTPRENPATGKIYGWVAFRPDRSGFLYALNIERTKWDKLLRFTVSDTPEALSRARAGSDGSSLDYLIQRHTDESKPFWREKIKTCAHAMAELAYLDSIKGILPWPPYDPEAGETE